MRRILSYNKKIMVFIGDKQQEMSFVKSYNFVKKGQFLAAIGSSNLIEIGINQGNAARKLDVKPDAEIKILLS